MMGRVPIAALACALAGCGQQAAVPDGDPETKPVVSPDEIAVGNAPASLVGNYRVAGADGAEVDLGWAITVAITGDTIRYGSQCVSGTWTYSYTGGRMSTEAVPIALCDRGRYPAEEALDAVFGGSPTVSRTAENGLLFEGGDHSVTLFSQ